MMSSATLYCDESRVFVPPFSRQPGGADECVVGRPETGIFLALPNEAVTILEDLQAGNTIGEVRDSYHRRYGEVPDLQDFLDAMRERGFIGVQDETASDTVSTTPKQRYHFADLPRWVPNLFFGRLTLGVYAIVIGLGIWVVSNHPHLLPTRDSLLFDEFYSVKILAVVALALSAVFIHEMSHLLAGQAVGVPSRMGFSHRLWIVVAETDLTGLWSVPKRKRFLPLVAGMITDLVACSVILLILWQHQELGVLQLPKWSEELLEALCFVYFLQLIWQFMFFVRTDMYYVISNAFDCKNLMGDTETWLKNKVSRLFPRRVQRKPLDIPARERGVVRAYSVVWVLGRFLALTILVTVTWPVAVGYLMRMISPLQQGGADMVQVLDAFLFAGISITMLTVGMTMWIRSLAKR